MTVLLVIPILLLSHTFRINTPPPPAASGPIPLRKSIYKVILVLVPLH